MAVELPNGRSNQTRSVLRSDYSRNERLNVQFAVQLNAIKHSTECCTFVFGLKQQNLNLKLKLPCVRNLELFDNRMFGIRRFTVSSSELVPNNAGIITNKSCIFSICRWYLLRFENLNQPDHVIQLGLQPKGTFNCNCLVCPPSAFRASVVYDHVQMRRLQP